MSQPLLISIPHRLGRLEARHRVDSGIGRLRPELNALLSGLDYRWEGDTLNFAASAMWQRITGRIEVLDDVVRVEIDLPWIMQLLRDTIAKGCVGEASSCSKGRRARRKRWLGHLEKAWAYSWNRRCAGRGSP
jgi:hypothetical protein